MKIDVKYIPTVFTAKYWLAPAFDVGGEQWWTRTNWRDIDGFIVKENGGAI